MNQKDIFLYKNELNATFIRFNPDDNNFNILDIISKIHYHMCNYNDRKYNT